MTVRIVFMGSPEFALPTLKALATHYQVVGVVTQPDRPAGRGRVLTPPPVKTLALELGLACIQPRRLRTPEAMQQLRTWEPDLIVVAAFGQILKSEVLDLPEYGCVNVHGSLLPRWRGAAPIQAALLNGDRQTGITIMRLDPGVDTGPVLSQRTLTILPGETAGELSLRMARLGADLLIETLPEYLNGSLAPQTQDDSHATYAPMIHKEEGNLDFSQPAQDLVNRIRAFNPWPGAYTFWKGQMLKIHRGRSVGSMSSEPAGKRMVFEGSPAFATSRGILVLEEVQPAGKKAMPGKAFLAGARDWTSESNSLG